MLTNRSRLVAAALALALVSAAMWAAWLGWDHEYYEVDGVPQGPYRPWQVLGCGASVATAAVAALLWAGGRSAPFVLAAAAVVGFAVPWSVDAGSTDESGLWIVGLLLLLIGGGLGLVALLSTTAAVVRSLQRRGRPRRTPSRGSRPSHGR